MPTAPLYTEDLLDPISAEQPAGADMRWTVEWDRIKEARRADDGLDAGKWAKRDYKTADWRAVFDLSSAMLRGRSKDLQIALWLTESGIKLHGFAGLRDGFRVTRELIARYWEKGLYPSLEDGPEDRARPFEWLNNKVVDSITAISITARKDEGKDYSYIDVADARRTGSEASCRDSNGELNSKKKKEYDAALANGHISMEMLDSALRDTPRARCEERQAEFLQAYHEFKELDRIIDEKFGDAAPNLGSCRSALNDIKQTLADFVARKRQDEPDPVAQVNSDAAGQASAASAASEAVVMRFSLPSPALQSASALTGDSWQQAEALVRSGEIDRGLAEMTRLAAGETSGRNRFQRKLLLAEACLAGNRERLARLILEELAGQIDKLQLEAWESSDLIGSVWTKLYRLYKRSSDSSDSDRATMLYERLCKLDPWQALGCAEG